MNGNFDVLVRELQDDRARELEQRSSQCNVLYTPAFLESRSNRLVAGAGRTLVKWGRRLQAVGQDPTGGEIDFLPAVK